MALLCVATASTWAEKRCREGKLSQWKMMKEKIEGNEK
jgi:hypothetical protein